MAEERYFVALLFSMTRQAADCRQRTTDNIPEVSFMPIGQGMVNIGNIIENFRERNMDWVIVEQDGATKGKNRMQCAEESGKYLAEGFNI